MADSLEQIVQSQGHPHKKDLGDEVGRDAGAKQRFGGCDVAGRRRRSFVHDQLVGYVHQGEGARYGHEYIQQAYESTWILGGTHIVLACESFAWDTMEADQTGWPCGKRGWCG